MHPDEIYTLAWERKKLQIGSRGKIKGTPSQLKAMGLLSADFETGVSVVQKIRRQQEEEAKKAAAKVHHM